MKTYNDFLKIHINIPSISIMLFLFLAFHYTAYSIFHIDFLNFFLICVFSLFLLGLIYIKSIEKCNVLIGLWMVVLMLSLFRNGYLKYGEYIRYIGFWTAVAFAFLLQYSFSWYRFLKKWLVFFVTEHFLLSWMFFFFNDFYIKTIIPMFSEDVQKSLIRWNDNNILLGLTNHYSTSGMYFAVGVIVMFAIWVQNPQNKRKTLSLLFMMASLMMTQKRGPFLFAVIALIFTYMAYNRVSGKTILKFAAYVLAAFLIFMAVDCLYPELGGVLARFSLLSDDDVTNGRLPLYMVAIKIFQSNRMFGIGWGQYKFYYERYGFGDAISAHNIYLQLLAEVGLVGTVLICICFLYGLMITYQLLRSYAFKESDAESAWKFAVLFSFAMQIFFLLYGFTGSPLYDLQCMFPYFLSIAVSCSMKHWEKQKSVIKSGV